MSSPPQKAIHSLVVDTGPLIKNTISISTIIQSAEHIYTTRDVISEIKDAATRSRVETTLLPFLTLRNPAPASYEVVAQFSKKTGDFPVLSRQDLGILALAYELDQERHKEEEKVESPSEGAQNDATTQDDASKDVPAEAPQEDQSAASETEANQTAPQPSEPTPAASEPTQSIDSLQQGVSNLQVSSEEAQEPAHPIGEAEPSDEDEDDDGEWITPSNLKQHQARDSGVSLQETQVTQLRCATMTTDFAMQNVLLQMQLSLISPSMQRIQTLRTYILRCHACFLTTKEMTRQFCPRCGQPTLNRVACSTNAKGEFKLHLSKSHQWNNRGNKFSVPKTVSGTASGKHAKGGGKGGWGQDLVLAEDERKYLRAVTEEKRTKTRDLMDEDYLPGILTGDRGMGRAGGRPKVGAGKNVNSKKRF